MKDHCPDKYAAYNRRWTFEHYLRTGQGNAATIEAKFNPWHDPDDGRFTFAGQGNHVARGTARSSSKNKPSAARLKPSPEPGRQEVTETIADSSGATRTEATVRFPAAALSATHRDFLSYRKKFPAKAGTQTAWSDFSHNGLSKGEFKDQYIAGHSSALRAAAKLYDLPVELVASVGHAEVGNDNILNDIAYAGRAENGRNIPALPIIGPFNKPRDETSFGPYGIQQRRAAEILGYGDINKMSETARRALVPTTRDPVAATFMLAKHLSDLRDLDFAGVAGKDLTAGQLLIVATRYRRGPQFKLSEIQKNLKSGEDYLQLWSRVKRLLAKKSA